MDLTPDDLNTLIEALPHWVNRHVGEHAIGTLLTMVACRDKEERTAQMERDSAKYVLDCEAAKVRRERCTLLQAKLITLRDRLAVDTLTS